MDKKQFLGSKGFTLIEVLVSTLILGIVIGITLIASSGFMAVWQRSDTFFSDVFVSARYRILLRESVESIYDYYVSSKTGNVWSDRKKDKYSPFFEGKANSVEFVTLSSVFNHGEPAIAMLSTQKDDSGMYNLVYKEADFENFFIKYAQDKIQFSRQIILYQHLEKIEFRYYGLVETRVDQKSLKTDTIFKWEEQFSGSKTGHIPEQMEITINSGETGKKIMRFKIKAENKYKNGFFNPPF